MLRDRETKDPMTPDYRHQDEADALIVGSLGYHLFVAPTGTGKTRIQRRARRHFPNSVQLVPGPDIARQFPDEGVWTYKTFLNRLRDGSVDPTLIDTIFRDEAHHLDDTNEQIDEFFPHAKRIFGFTATDYRGTPAETMRLRTYYKGNIHRLITIKDAIARGIMALPTVEIYPLHNDDEISVKGGDFVVSQVNKMVESRFDDLVNLVTTRFWDPEAQRYTRPIMICFTSVYLCEEFARRLPLPSAVVTGETTGREEAFARVVNREAILVQIKVVGEGVDLPIRVMIDCAPTMSPVFWMQRFGRITRPTDVPPLYIVTNHNLMRHAYLMEGAIPATAFKDYDKKFPGWKPNARAAGRIIGEVQGFSKFKPAEVPLADGSNAMGICIDDPSGRGHQYACLIHPATDKAIFARRDFVTKVDEDGRTIRDYSKKPKWRSITELPDLSGYTSTPASPLTPAQSSWWEKQSARVGLDNKRLPNARGFAFFPILLDLGVRVKL
jgi:hypothetical protein